MILCPKSQEPVLDKGEYYIFPGYPLVKCYKLFARAQLAMLDYARIFAGHSPLFLFYSATRGNQFEARLNFDPTTKEFHFAYELPNCPPLQHPRLVLQEYLKVVYPPWQFTPQKLHTQTVPAVEYRITQTGQVQARALVEYLRLDKPELAPGLRAAILERHRKENRARSSCDLARELGVNYYLILHTRCVTKFAIYNMTEASEGTPPVVDTDGLQSFYQGLQT